MSDRNKATAAVRTTMVAIIVISGCRSTGSNSCRTSIEAPKDTAETSGNTGLDALLPAYLTVASAAYGVQQANVSDDGDLFAGDPVLELSRLTAEVIRRNPTLEAMAAAWRVATRRGPQVTSLEDPTFGFMVGPASIGSSDVDFGWMVQGSQKIPWPGKRQLRGLAAQYQSAAAFQDFEEARLKLMEAATRAYLEYYAAERELELNAQNVAKLRDILEVAYRNLEANKVAIRDVADVEVQILFQNQRQAEWERGRRVAAARINLLLHRPPTAFLPPAPNRLPEPRDLPPLEILHKQAVERRPELAAEAARLRAEESEVALRCKEFYPDLEFVARYDGFWQGADRDLAPQIGLNLNVPLQTERRRAAVDEAMQNVIRRRAEFQARLDEIQFEVLSAVEQLELARKAIDRFAGHDGILEKAELSAESVRASYETSAADFPRLIEAQRKLIDYRDKLVEYKVEYLRRLAELERAVGGPISTATSP